MDTRLLANKVYCKTVLKMFSHCSRGDNYMKTTLMGQKFFLTKIFPYIFHIKLT